VSDSFFENAYTAPRPVWVSLNWVLAGFISLIFLMTLAMRYLPETSKREEVWAQIQDLEATLSEKRAILQRNERQERLLRTSSEYLSMKARDRLDLMQEGETLYRFEVASSKR
jgi:cell division protein FtsB